VSSMPIYALLKKQDAFAPEQVEALARVFKDVLQALGLVHRTDPVTELVAKKVVEVATGGISDPDRLRALTIQAFTQQQQQQLQRLQRQDQRQQQKKPMRGARGTVSSERR